MATEQARNLLEFSPKLSLVGSSAASEKLSANLSTSLVNENAVLKALQDLIDASVGPSTSLSGARTQIEGRGNDAETSEVQAGLLVKSAISTLSLTMDQLLQEAIQAERELEWWRGIESSRWNTAYFLLQTSPIRIARLAHDIAIIAKRNEVALSFANLNRETFRLRIAPHLQVFRSLFPSNQQYSSLADLNRFIPSELARQECAAHRKELESVRDRRAMQLGQLSFLGTTVVSALNDGMGSSSGLSATASIHDKYTTLAQLLTSSMEHILSEHSQIDSPNIPPTLTIPNTIGALQNFLTTSLPGHISIHTALITTHQRPGKWTLAWPRLVLIPPILLIVLKSAFNNRDAITTYVRDARETVTGFWVSWVVEPVSEILNTVRTGGDDSMGRVVSKDGLRSDMDSLERMVVSLATEKHNLSESELSSLRSSIQSGDLTSVLQVYESDIKSPLKSAVSGTLIRSLLIQIQKAKVDIDLALAGIDKLLKSQELTFGFVGVAPSLTVLYVVLGWVWEWVIPGAQGKRTKFGGRRNRRESFYAMRRIDRLLTQAQPSSSSATSSSSEPQSMLATSFTTLSQSFTPPALPLAPQTHGRLLIDLTHLRHCAERHFFEARSQSQAREAFLDDLRDLEDPRLGKEDKLRVVERMWRCWSGPVGWGNERYL